MKRSPFKRNPEAIREWQKRSAKRWQEKSRKIAKETKPRKPLKKLSASRARQMDDYYRLRNEWLAAHPACVACCMKGEAPRPAQELHHYRGRAGKLLTDTRFFMGVCREHHEAIHANPAKARKEGLLAPAGEWNCYPKISEFSF